MKLFGICGSLSSTSYNLRFLKAFGELKPANASFDFATLHDIPMYSPDNESQPDSVRQLCASIKAADRIVIATPEYNYSIPGVLKNALDWVSRDPENPFHGKVAAIIGASPGGIGTARCQYHLRQVGVFLNIHFLNKPEVMISKCHEKMDDNGNITDEPTKEHLKKLMGTLCGPFPADT